MSDAQLTIKNGNKLIYVLLAGLAGGGLSGGAVRIAFGQEKPVQIVKGVDEAKVKEIVADHPAIVGLQKDVQHLQGQADDNSELLKILNENLRRLLLDRGLKPVQQESTGG